ncbi:MAG: hypothetical protein KAJ19_06390 [Gammaproteobacteria bacterium]|nr:hypothetical protein [Gammaproteobacteria bacterium]
MKRYRLYDVKPAEPRESLWSVNDIITKCSRVTPENGLPENDYIEMCLCLANEVKRLRKELENIIKW